MQSIDIQGFSYEEPSRLLPQLIDAIDRCGGWVLERHPLSSTTTQLHVEIQLRSALELYGTLVASGLELTRDSHFGLTALCSCRNGSPGPSRRGHVLRICLEVSFLDHLSLRSLLMTGSAIA
jgi:hypothetical protein